MHDCIAALYHKLKELNKLPQITVNTDLVDDFNEEMEEGALQRMESLYNVKVIS